MAHDHEVADVAARLRPVTPTRRPTTESGPVALAGRAASPSSLLRLQRLAGNVAVQRVVGGDEVTTSVEPAAAAAPAPAAAAPAAAAPGANTLGDGTGPVSINGPTVGIHAPMVQADGVLQASTIIADSVVASSYSPGAGNVW